MASIFLMMKRLFLMAFLVCVIAPASYACEDGEIPDNHTGSYTKPLFVESADTGDRHQFFVELAVTPATVMKGLMYRSAMDANHGMYFIFPSSSERSFWMKNTLIPLDILFITGDKKIHEIHENAIPHDETALPSNGPILTVLELNGGTVKKLGIKKGDYVELGKIDDVPERSKDSKKTSPLEALREKSNSLAQ